MGSSSPPRDGTQASCTGNKVSATGLPGKSLPLILTQIPMQNFNRLGWILAQIPLSRTEVWVVTFLSIQPRFPIILLQRRAREVPRFWFLIDLTFPLRKWLCGDVTYTPRCVHLPWQWQSTLEVLTVPFPSKSRDQKPRGSISLEPEQSWFWVLMCRGALRSLNTEHQVPSDNGDHGPLATLVFIG